MTDIIEYDAKHASMLNAIIECHSVHEIKDMRDQALALEIYARQAKNTDAERKACDIRLRAERKAGQLLKELAERGERQGDGRPEKRSEAATVSAPQRLSDLGISKQDSSKYQQLAAIPEQEFEAALADPVRKPSTAGLIREARTPAPAKTMSDAALGIWGTLRDMERLGYFRANRQQVISEMTETMLADLARLLPSAIDLFNELQELQHEHA